MKRIMSFFNNSLRNKLITLLLLISLVPVIILSYLGINKIESVLKENFVQSTTKEIRQVDNAINLYFETVKENCQMLASNNFIKQADETITTYMNKTTEEELNMTPLQNGGVEAKIYKKFLHFAKTHPKSAYVYMATKNGGYIQWPANSLMKNYDPRERPFYKTAMENKGEVVRTEPYYFAADDAVIVSTVTTIKDKAGEIIGVQGLDVSLKGLTNMVKEIEIGKTGYMIVTTGDGTILAHPKRPELNFKSIKKLGVDKLNNISKLKNSNFETRMNQQDYLMNVYTSPETGWKFISVMKKSELTSKLSNIYKLVLGIVLIAAIIIIIIAVIFSNRFTEPIIAATDFAQKIAKGNLDIKSLDNELDGEIGSLSQALNDMQSSLKDMIANLINTIEDLSAYSEELSASAEEGNAVIESSNQNIEGMTASIQQISATSQEVTGLAQEANSQAEIGSSKVEELTSITEVNEAVNNAVNSIDELDSNSQEIGKIIELITNIAEQTNLLALNAAIEAARAGEHGQGFAVVAEEIRELAEETAKATQEIDTLIKDTQDKSEDGLQAVKQVEDKVKDRNELVKETGKVFAKIKESIEETSAHIQQTAASTQGLAENSDEVMNASQDINNMSEEVTKSSQELANMAQKLQGLIEKFRI
ncbi:methyl-accepting chemotaxis protein [Selenihalanaerobacter shriftii]|uniref:Methyl-accepting chemotaxis sensory transducer with Cache sensor n=1 Tax=Selenihalanaerobacter shriftii TaxID=142842 RepID=A0A1T4K9E4_9FIRM|nr:methyl-accepting chemotaxis protein [Selenihalanaerobacter shriftii]SJZ39068.1 methyl-accepting chemotaxis sensory transducer with Cache sensor [Selenihalanaerobacter shriftii]